MAIADRSSSHNVNSNINVTPMVDVMLVLLIIFMVITPMLTNKVSIELAQVKNLNLAADERMAPARLLDGPSQPPGGV